MPLHSSAQAVRNARAGPGGLARDNRHPEPLLHLRRARSNRRAPKTARVQHRAMRSAAVAVAAADAAAVAAVSPAQGRLLPPNNHRRLASQLISCKVSLATSAASDK